MPKQLLSFEEIRESDFSRVGGKAYTLSRLLQTGFPVPAGCVLFAPPKDEQQRQEILEWWRSQGVPPLAVRSSGADEDSSEHSFAGQHRSFLDVRDPEALFQAIEGCFASGSTVSTDAYRKALSAIPDLAAAGGMGVVLQRLVRPEFAGVYFTRDPRGGQGGLLEVVRGLGESLVSGHETPIQIEQGQMLSEKALAQGWKPEHSEAIFETGRRISETLGYEADIEWAIDSQGALWVLQSRPITTLEGAESKSACEAHELKRLRAANSPGTIWDGQTFAEWTGTPTPLSLSLWQRAFTRAGALGTALRELGYSGSGSSELSPHESVLDSVFARPYVNLSRMERLYFGATPYVMVPHPRPHLKFRWGKLTAKALVNCAPGTLRMMRSAWRLATGRRKILADAETALARFQRMNRLPMSPDIYATWDAKSLLSHWEDLSHRFSNEALVEPLKLMVAIESVRESLIRTIGEAKLNEWLGSRLRLPSLGIAQEFSRACADPSRKEHFLALYGHRGPGELDLAEPRWIELGWRSFASLPGLSTLKENSETPSVEAASPRARMAEEDWAILSSMLELREHWKDALLLLYAHLRWTALELGRKVGFESDIFWLRPVELEHLLGESEAQRQLLKLLVVRRRKSQTELKKVSLPVIFSLDDLEPGRKIASERVEKGEGLSGGLAYGQVRLVSDPAQVDWGHWPEDAVLVAENTDPGWTPLFARAKAVVTERGGALSHCAIVAREMGLPAVSGVRGCMSKYKEGEHVWVDGTRGSVTRV